MPQPMRERTDDALAAIAQALARDVDGHQLEDLWIDHLVEALKVAQDSGLQLTPTVATTGPGAVGRARRWLAQRIALGSTVTAGEREGLPELRVPLQELTPLEVLAYWHPKPQVRLVANRLARKLDLNVTEVCNYDCFYCYQRSRDDDWEAKATKAAERELPISEWVAIVREAHALGVRRVKITGGEPLTKRGVDELIDACVRMPGLEEIELCTNASLLDRHADRIAAVIGSAPDRFHVHTSIDGIDDGPRSRTLTKASREHLASLERLMETSLRNVRVSVNSMWNSELTDETQLAELHGFMARGRVERWTVSYPYFVRDFIASSVGDSDAMPSYSAVVEAAARLVSLHRAAGTPFRLSIPLLVKHELLDEGYAVSGASPTSHPCFPCHGSYFVIGPEGHVFDCLLLNWSSSNVRSHDSIWTAGLAAAADNPFYRLTTHEVARDCVGCRYADLCHGQCANDRANTHPGLDGKTFGRDRSACSMLPLAESRIWSRAPKELQRAIATRLDPDGFIPARWSSPHAVATFAAPEIPDRHADDSELELIPEALVRAASTVHHDLAESAFGAIEREPEPRRPSARAVFHQTLPERLRP